MNKENLLKEIEHVFGLEKGYYPYNKLPSTISYAILKILSVLWI